MSTATGKSGGCGCAPADPAAIASWSLSKGGCGCGCSGAGGCSCGGGATQTGGALAASCTSGSAEASKRPGVVTSGCLAPRPRFFPGELVTDADLTAMVDYHRAQQLLANGVIGGWGVYCGFSLCIDETTCTLCVGPGIAVDARGRSLVHDTTLCIKRPDPSQVDARGECDPCAKRPDEELFLAIVYDDCLDGAKPRYGSVCGPGPDPGCDFSRIRERGRFVWIRELDDGYWTSGCLTDPCADPVPAPDANCMPEAKDRFFVEPTLDECTPCIGIRGGVGVATYAARLDAQWALSRNAQLLSDPKQKNSCGVGAATMIDVISGVACQPCRGEAVVVLAGVRFATSADGLPGIQVQPLRRRVLSNANLTYLVEWLMDYVICQTRSSQARPESSPPPSNTGLCADPCIDDKKIAEQIGEAAVGKDGKNDALRMAAESRAAWWITFQGRRNLAAFDRAAFLDVVAAAYGSKRTSKHEDAALQRYYDLLGRAAREPAIKRGVDFLYPNGVPEAKRASVEDAVFAFLERHRVDELGEAKAPVVLTLANSINEGVLGRGAFPADQQERLKAVLPGGAAAPAELEVATLRERVRELEQEVTRITVAGAPAPEIAPKPVPAAEAAPEEKPEDKSEEKPGAAKRKKDR